MTDPINTQNRPRNTGVSTDTRAGATAKSNKQTAENTSATGTSAGESAIVELSNTTLLEELNELVKGLPQVNEARVEAVKQALSNGEYEAGCRGDCTQVQRNRKLPDQEGRREQLTGLLQAQKHPHRPGDRFLQRSSRPLPKIESTNCGNRWRNPGFRWLKSNRSSSSGVNCCKITVSSRIDAGLRALHRVVRR